MNDFLVGSEWRRWDLHVHTPDSVLANEFKCSWEKYIEHIENNGETVAVIGVTDYASISGYKKLRAAKNSGKLNNIAELLPNIEFRITPETKKSKGINVHIIVDPSDKHHIEQIEEALSRLSFKYDGQPHSCSEIGLKNLGRKIKGVNASSEECMKEGVNQFKPMYESFFDWYNNEPWLKINSVIATANGSNDGVSGISQDGGLLAAKQNIYKLTDFIFSATPKDASYFSGMGVDSPEQVIEKYGSLKACIHGSDAHALDTMFKPDKGRFCWIKADPTFEGLKQVMYEPVQRVLIQSENPSEEFKRPYFSKITTSGSIVETELPKFNYTVSIPLNPNMVTLIGGRGTGKSILLDCIRKTFAKGHMLSEQRIQDIQLKYFKIELTKSDHEKVEFDLQGEDHYDYLHVKQSEIKDVAKDHNALSLAIKKLLGIPNEIVRQSYDIETETLNKRLEAETNWFHKKDELGNLINHLTYNNNLIRTNEALIETITTDGNREKIQSYQENSRIINNNINAKQSLEELKSKLVSYTLEIKRDIQEFNKLDLDVQQIIEPNLVEVEKSINESSVQLSTTIVELNQANEKIADSFKKQGVEQDVGGLLQKLAIYQKEISSARSRIDMYDSKLSIIKNDIEARTILVSDVESHLEARQSVIKNSYTRIKDGENNWTTDQRSLVDRLLRDIEIDAEVDFDLLAFGKEVASLLNGQKLRNNNGDTKEERALNKLGVKSLSDYLNLLKNEKMIDIGTDNTVSITKFVNRSEQFNKNIKFSLNDLLFLDEYRKKYLTINPIIRYLGKSPEKLSVGQRGTFYVCLKLATDPFGSPFIFDQPEDDLDNKFIMKELVPIFREIKKHRQVIIATHNANLVVNADAEQVIIAHNNDEIISYQAGSLENTNITTLGIRENVCEILEGGQRAFENRERKYGFN